MGFLYFCLLCLLVTLGESKNYPVEQKIMNDADLSQFYTLLENSREANGTLHTRQATVFAPYNLAFQKLEKSGRAKKLPSSTAVYHMTNIAKTLDQLESSELSEMDGNPPLWITRRQGSKGEEIYVNNAKIIKEQSNYQQTTDFNKKQVLHVIDSVLEPVLSTQPDQPIYNPDAYQFLNQSENIEIDSHRLRSYRQRVFQNNKGDIYKADGKFTFFIPVDEGFRPPPRPDKIDQKVIDAHVIPNQVLFTAPTPKDIEYPTLAVGDMLKVTVSFSSEEEPNKPPKYYVKSNTISGDSNHGEGVVMAEIVKPNIPVKNGVVHLINRPLAVIDATVLEFLEEKDDGPLLRFCKVIMDYGGTFMDQITKMNSLTLFAPSNEAWQKINLNELMGDRQKLGEILRLHLVSEKLPVDVILEKNTHQIFQVATTADRKSIYFNVVRGPHNQTLTVEGGGVNATVIQPNIAATNGIIHIIDRVLGVPYTTVADKLATDPMLNKTYYLGRDGFNNRLSDPTKRFTYFVTRDYGWTKAELDYPSAYKKMFMREFQYHTNQILERHLVQADEVYTMARLKYLSMNGSIVLPSVRDHLRIRVRDELKGYVLEWENKRIHVFRPDVECINGIIHVIDEPFLEEKDIRTVATNGEGFPMIAPHLVMLLATKWLLL